MATQTNLADLYDQAQEYQKTDQHQNAITCYKNILSTNPLHFSALFNLGCCYLAIGKIEKALASFDTILSINPNVIPVLYNKAYTYKTAGQLDKAIPLYQYVIGLDPDYDHAHLALGFAYLINGDFENGWKQHERYLKKSGKNGEKLRSLLKNNNLTGKTIALHPEGGLGDSLHFIRYAQRLQAMGATVVAYVQKSLIPLFSLCPYIDNILPLNSPLASYDAQATLMSLPAIFEDTEKTFPNTVPYLQADETLVQQWKTYFEHDNNLKIGICWQADVHNDVSRLPIARRGCLLKYFAPLQNILGISLYSLQKYDGVEEIAQMPSDFPLHVFDHLDEQSGPFMDTAAIIKNLDLVITVDTAIAHLAGGLGKKVWLLLPYATDWRWINKRTDSPWYPTMKIFKQQTPFDWEAVLNEITQELNTLINKKEQR